MEKITSLFEALTRVWVWVMCLCVLNITINKLHTHIHTHTQVTYKKCQGSHQTPHWIYHVYLLQTDRQTDGQTFAKTGTTPIRKINHGLNKYHTRPNETEIKQPLIQTVIITKEKKVVSCPTKRPNVFYKNKGFSAY